MTPARVRICCTLLLAAVATACGGTAELDLTKPEPYVPGISVSCSGGDVPWFSRPATLVATRVKGSYTFAWDDYGSSWTPTRCATTSAVYASSSSADSRVPLSVNWTPLAAPKTVAVLHNGVISGPDGVEYLHFLEWNW